MFLKLTPICTDTTQEGILNRAASVYWTMHLFAVHNENLPLEITVAESFFLQVYLNNTAEVLDCFPLLQNVFFGVH